MLALLLRPMSSVAVCMVRLSTRAVRRRSIVRTRSGRVIPNADIYDRVVAEVLVATNDSVALFILKTHAGTPCLGRVETVEVLDGGDDRLGSVMWVDLHPHGNARPVLVRVLDQFELHRPGNGGLVVLGVDEVHDGGVPAHRRQNVCFGGSRRCVELCWVSCIDRTGLCSGRDVRCGRLCRHQTVWCHS